MTITIFSENLKKFRIAKGMTQEETALALHLNSHTISRWECGTTLPDVLTLPELAKLYDVTVDDFFKKHSIAYDNYADRLSSVYEKTHDPEDFLRCVLEYDKLIKNDEMSAKDQFNYAAVHSFMLRYCRKIALEWFDKAIISSFHNQPKIYSRATSLRNALLIDLGDGNKAIQQQKDKLALYPNEPLEYLFLIELYYWLENYEEAYQIYLKALKRFPDNWRVYIYGGDVYEALKNYDEAFKCWDKAGELGTDFYEEYYSKASCYADIGEYKKAYHLYMELAEKLRQDNYDVEAEIAEKDAAIMKQKM